MSVIIHEIKDANKPTRPITNNAKKVKQIVSVHNVLYWPLCGINLMNPRKPRPARIPLPANLMT